MKKKCAKCLELMPLTRFYKNEEMRLGVQSYCKKCTIENSILTNNNNKAKRSKQRMKRRYGIDWDEFMRRLNDQGTKCKICLKPIIVESYGFVDGWQIDHDHKDGKVRGILCGRCNTGLACFKDNPTVLIRASEYAAKQGEI